MTTLQTSSALEDMRLGISALTIGQLVHELDDYLLSYQVPYQRGAVWTTGQRVLLIYSLLTGTPVPALIINRRPDHMWADRRTGGLLHDDDGHEMPVAVVIDGKQRLMTLEMFLHDALAVPASWFPAEDVLMTEDTDDGPYVRWTGLALRQRRFFGNKPIPVAEAQLGSERAEAEVYLRVNGAGTPQTDEDLARAARVARVPEPRRDPNLEDITCPPPEAE